MRMTVRLIRPLLLSPFVRHQLRRYLSSPSRTDLEVLKALVEAKQLRPVIDTSFALEETPTALRHIEGGHARGKVVIAV
jgi:NADPH:quinone reductase-like Zn-dependent oxidoreductase